MEDRKVAIAIEIGTKEELQELFSKGLVDEDCPTLTLDQVFEILCEHYGVDPHWAPNDVY